MTKVSPRDLLDLDKLAATQPETVPFPFIIVPNFVRTGARGAVLADFPDVRQAGSFPLPSLSYGPSFKALVDALMGPDMARIVEKKFSIDLSNRPTMATVRGRCEARDGQIHTDSKTKLVTLLLYMNDHPNAAIGRLRILRSSSDLNDIAAEVPPDEGTLLLFLNGPNAWHGFEPFSGPRRVIQVNWVTDDSVVRREQGRHRMSAFIKRLVSKHAAAH